jgi:DNA polymerase I-like protein with 3'-5' exonuclease and polymerase domains
MNKLKFRSMFIAPKDKYLLQVDLSQAESWVVAWEAKDENMKYSLQNGDIHTDTATIIFEVDKSQIDPKGTQRYLAKRINHGSGYGMKPPRQTEIINKDSSEPPYLVVTVPEVTKYQDKWHGHFWRVREWHGEIRDELRLNRTLITTYGRKRVFYGQMPSGDTGEFWKEAYAYKPQSTVADHFTGLLHPELQIPGGMKEIWKQICVPYPDIKMINMSHDSLILEVPKTSILPVALSCKHLLERPLIINGEQFTIPVDAEYGERNGEWEKIKAA